VGSAVSRTPGLGTPFEAPPARLFRRFLCGDDNRRMKLSTRLNTKQSPPDLYCLGVNQGPTMPLLPFQPLTRLRHGDMYGISSTIVVSTGTKTMFWVRTIPFGHLWIPWRQLGNRSLSLSQSRLRRSYIVCIRKCFETLLVLNSEFGVESELASLAVCPISMYCAVW
jgi:hypothetical protein